MRTAVAALRPAVVRHPRPPQDPSRPKGLNVLGTLAHNPELATAYHTLTGYILFGSNLSARQRELLVLRVAAVRGSRYEWLQHTILAADAGITPEEVRRVIDGPDADGWERFEEALVRAADELVATARIGDDTWSTLRSELDEKAILDVIFTVGTYDVLAMTFLSCGVEVDDDLRPLEDELRGNGLLI